MDRGRHGFKVASTTTTTTTTSVRVHLQAPAEHLGLLCIVQNLEVSKFPLNGFAS